MLGYKDWEFINMLNGKARAYTNIALIKYWGKEDPELILPKNNSLSLTLDGFFTETEVLFSKDFTQDIFYLDGMEQSRNATKKVSTFLDLVRKRANCPFFAVIHSHNHVPTAAGLASSASGLAALAGACNQALALNLSPRELSQLARRGSGSACRSIFGGFVEWERGHSDATSYAVPIDAQGWEKELAMVFVLINDQPKDISSREGMQRTVETSAFYPQWVEEAQTDLQLAKAAIQAHDFQKLGIAMEANGLKMHATTLAATPPFTYWSPDSLRAMTIVRTLRQEGIPCYFTMDAGPNVKILCQKKNVQAIQAALAASFEEKQIIAAYPGPGIQFIETEVTK